MHKSHITQQLLNYYDAADQRVRQHPYSIDAQLLNLAAFELESLELRSAREIAARFVKNCPSLIDNRGVYYSARIPARVYVADGQNEFQTVEGYRNGAWVELKPYDDTLPVPVRVELDAARAMVALSDPKLFDVVGSDAGLQTVVSDRFALPIPGPLSFWVENGSRAPHINLLIEGTKSPASVWPARRGRDVEELTISAECLTQSKFAWASVDRITVRNLEAGIRLACWHAPFALPAVADMARPFTDARFRDQLFPRYWRVLNLVPQLQETYYAGPLRGLEYVQSYSTPVPLVDLAVEPWTNGGIAVSENTLYYFDRREPFPARLDATALRVEPLYSTLVSADPVASGMRRALLTPLAHAGAERVARWRYIVEDPSGTAYAIGKDGAFIPYSGRAGWSLGTPVSLSVPLPLDGTHVFSLECADQDGKLTADQFPYANFALNTTVFELSNLVPEVRGIGFDQRDRLWIWTGDFAVPVRFAYDAYVLDSDSRTVFLTDKFDKVRVS